MTGPDSWTSPCGNGDKPKEAATEEWERDVLLPLARQRVELDLDDGVKTKYIKLGDALAPIPGLSTKGKAESTGW